MKRLPLLPGKTTPEGIVTMLAQFGKNPHGEPMYRFAWSERKQIWFAGEVVPEYRYLDPQAWVLEAWLDPETDSGPEALWGTMQEALLGPYPTKGTYQFAQQFAVADEESVRLYVVGIEKSRELTIKQRRAIITEAAEEREAENVATVAEGMVESYTSADFGKTQQAVSGRNNKFRTVDDYVRDVEQAKPAPHKLPRHGGKLII